MRPRHCPLLSLDDQVRPAVHMLALVRCSASRVLPQFDPKSKRVESNTFDELGKTKSSAKESSRAGWMGGLWVGLLSTTTLPMMMMRNLSPSGV